LRIVIAPDSFKDCLSAQRVAQAIARGVRQAMPESLIDLVPMADGGQGTVDAILASVDAHRRPIDVTGPLGTKVQAELALLKNGTLALFEMASASGLEIVPPADRNPMLTTTRGTGELLRAALDAGVERILIGIGGSATNDGGIGLAQALGYRLLDEQGNEIPLGGQGLKKLASIHPDSRHPLIGQIPIDVACDVTNPLTGPTGASAIYGPQKGATPAMVEELDQGLAHLANVVRRDLGVNMDSPGSGAAGGLGGGLIAFAEARLCRGIDIVIQAVELRDRLRGADLCLTGEGRLDQQSAFGKTASGVAQLARELGVPVVAIVGARSGPTSSLHQLGLSAIFDVTPGPMSLNQAVDQAEENISYVAEQVARLFLVRCQIDVGK
jgi:glycerate kinase